MLLNQLIESRLLNKRKTAYCISGVLQYCDGILQNRFVVHLQSFFLNTPKFLIKSHLLAGSLLTLPANNGVDDRFSTLILVLENPLSVR